MSRDRIEIHEKMKLWCQEDLKVYKCEICEFETHLKVSLKDHLHFQVDHNPNNLLQGHSCGRCNFRTYSLLVLGGHVCPESIQKSEKSKCLQCEQCADKRSLNKHILSAHTAPEDTIQPNLRKHQNRVKRHKCEWCDYSTKSGGNLRQHVQKKHPEVDQWLKCEQCEYTATGGNIRAKLRQHVYLRHTASEHIKWFVCEYCGFKAKVYGNLKQHILKKHPERTTGAIPRYLNQKYKCQLCQYETNSKSNLYRHNYIQHTDSEHVKWFECKQCDYKAKLKNNLDRHVSRRHAEAKAGETLHECDSCGFKSASRSHLDHHRLNKHTDSEVIDWFGCEYCSFKTWRKRSIELHRLRKHTDSECIEWVECQYCDYKAKTKDSVGKHTKSKHKNPEERQIQNKKKD